MPRINVDEKTKVEFFKFKRELETELNIGKELSQTEFLAILCKHKVQILDVIVELELVPSTAEKTNEKVAA